jgi:hypothetical protein
MKSFAIEASIPNREMMEKVLAGGVRDPKSFANQMTDKRYAAFASGLQFRSLGENATTYNPAQRPAVDKYVRQTLEEDAGKSNEGVRLALYFERKAKTVTSFYEMLADPALAKVVRTALGLARGLCPSRHRQAGQAVRADKLKIETFSNPKKLGEVPQALHQPLGNQQPFLTGTASVGVLFGSVAFLWHFNRRVVCHAES